MIAFSVRGPPGAPREDGAAGEKGGRKEGGGREERGAEGRRDAPGWGGRRTKSVVHGRQAADEEQRVLGRREAVLLDLSLVDPA